MKVRPEKQTLVHQYISLDMSVATLCFVHGASKRVIKQWLEEYNIPLKDNVKKWKKFVISY
jgi:hypothetical protein